ncbi:general substrate transporter [Dactylonectria estremocensis]|uniref:General substrate transporter n=1 Tax=Dactylonectria estremocensis TaxID=1079267 RepID=A0A9P9IHB9_9HYPO|nr:general substrate transporter [Dactylonectria estremocensis]
MSPSIKDDDSKHKVTFEMLEASNQPRISAWESAKANPKVILYSTCACMSSILWGFDIGVGSISAALPGFKLVFGYQYEGQLLLSATWNALWSAMSSLGMLIGSVICGWFADTWGRRASFILGAALSILGVGIEYMALSAGVLLAGKSINGLALGFFLTLGPLYASEIAPLPLRPALTAAVNLFINAGQMTAIGIGNTRFTDLSPASYKVLFAAQWAFPCFILLFAFVMPESPWYLCRKGREDLAEKSLQRLYSKKGDSDPAASTMEEIKNAIMQERALNNMHENSTYADCFKGTNFRRTRISCGMFVIQQSCGIAFYAQALYFLGIIGLPNSLTFKLALAGFGVAMFGNMLSWGIMSYVGRRKLILVGIVLNALVLTSTGIAGCVSSTAALYYIAYTMNFAQAVYAPTIGAASWVICAEVSSLELRARTQGLATISNALTSWVLNFITPYLINTDQANLGGKAAFVWVGLCGLSLVWAWFEVPEFRGLSAMEMDGLFAAKKPTRRFKH